MCVCVCLSTCAAVGYHKITPTGACDCLLVDRHTHVAQWECWETNENAILLTDTLKHTTCNHFKDMFL